MMKNTCNNAEGSQNPEKQPTLVAGKQSNGKSQGKSTKAVFAPKPVTGRIIKLIM
jgi:hypothetical protein